VSGDPAPVFGDGEGHVWLWICAIAAALVMVLDFFFTAIILPSLAGTSLMVIYNLFG